MIKKIIKKTKSEIPVILVSFVFALFITFILLRSVQAYANKVVNNISNEVFRLHVIANSDSESDQKLKIKVRDAILSRLNEELEKSESKEETQYIMFKNIDVIKECAAQTIKNEGYDYPVSVEIGNEYFPEKHYGDIRLPAGNYDGLKVTIGDGSGKNWWCVMYPPLCFVDASCVVKEADKTKLKKNLSTDDYRLITESDSVPITIKFKIIEMFK